MPGKYSSQYCSNIIDVVLILSMSLTGLVSAIVALDGKQYNSMRSKLHNLANNVNTRMTVTGFKVCLRSPPLARNTSSVFDRSL